jgi:hypothetical protein
MVRDKIGPVAAFKDCNSYKKVTKNKIWKNFKRND